MRNGGAIIDVRARTVRERNGLTYPIEHLSLGDHGLYYGRPTDRDHRYWWYQERWVIPSVPVVVNRFAFHAHRTDAIDWYIEADMVDVDGDEWRIGDGYLDILLQEGSHYDLDDAGELADGIALSEITIADAITALRSLDRICVMLRANGHSGYALLRELAPSLPASILMRDAGGVFAPADGAPMSNIRAGQEVLDDA